LIHKRIVRPEQRLERELLIKVALLNLSPDTVIMIDKRGTIVEASKSACTLFGYTHDVLVGGNIAMLMGKRDGANHHGFVERYLTTKTGSIIGSSRDLVGRHKDGDLIPIHLKLEEVWDGGEPLFLSFIRDRRPDLERKAREEDLQSRMDALSRQATMGELATGLAHEINQPLTAIDQYLSALELMLGDKLDEEASKILHKTKAQAVRAGEVLRSIRRFVRVHKPMREEIDLRLLVKETLSLALLRRDKQRIRIDKAGVPKDVLINVDKVQIQQVLLNLIRNSVDAIDHQTEGWIKITSRIEDGCVFICVTDNGSGVSLENEPRLFEHFFSSKPNGVGVGLALCQSIITSHGGKIWYEHPMDISGDQPGSRFCISLPLDDESATA